jgi:hypothetical protein
MFLFWGLWNPYGWSNLCAKVNDVSALFFSRYSRGLDFVAKIPKASSEKIAPLLRKDIPFVGKLLHIFAALGRHQTGWAIA